MEILNNLQLLFSVLTLNLITLTAGNIFSWPSPMFPKLNGKEGVGENPLGTPLIEIEESWLASVSLLGACAGSIFSKFAIHALGRKFGLLVLTVPAIAGYTLFAAWANLIVYFVARILCGITLGAALQIVPVYVAEISEVRNRGAMGCVFAAMIALGHLFTFSVGPYVSFTMFNVYSLLIPAVFMILVFCFIHESPYYYMQKENPEEAEKILRKLRYNSTNEEIMRELSSIRESIKIMSDQLKLTEVLSSKALRKSLLICVSLAVLQQLSAINAVVSYMQYIFDLAGGHMDSKVSSILVGGVELLTTLVTPHLVDRFGRKILLTSSILFLCLSLAGLGTYFFFEIGDYDVSSVSSLPLLCLFVYVIFFNIGMGSIVYVIIGEIFPANAKNISSTITICFLFVAGFAVTWLFPYLISVINAAYTFWIASICCGLGFILMLRIIPETKGKTFLEIQDILSK